MKNALNYQVGMLGDMFLWLVANLKLGVIYFIKQGGGNHKIASVYHVMNTYIVQGDAIKTRIKATKHERLDIKVNRWPKVFAADLVT